mgnify:CR=1 FL=1|jgi:hypothetical protein
MACHLQGHGIACSRSPEEPSVPRPGSIVPRWDPLRFAAFWLACASGAVAGRVGTDRHGIELCAMQRHRFYRCA